MKLPYLRVSDYARANNITLINLQTSWGMLQNQLQKTICLMLNELLSADTGKIMNSEKMSINCKFCNSMETSKKKVIELSMIVGWRHIYTHWIIEGLHKTWSKKWYWKDTWTFNWEIWSQVYLFLMRWR